MLVALLHFSVATHYCMGEIAASKISLSGSLANCGMENDENVLPSTGTYYTEHCCDNVLVFCGINGGYLPSFNFVPESFNNDFQVFSLPADLNMSSIASYHSGFTCLNPPGVSLSHNVDLATICVFRI